MFNVKWFSQVIQEKYHTMDLLSIQIDKYEKSNLTNSKNAN